MAHFLFNSKLEHAFKAKSVLKVITGIENTNITQIIKIAEASRLANVTYLDIAANSKLVKILKLNCDLPICVSSIDPVDIYNCVVSGADLVEIGNYDYFYKKGIYLAAEEIIDLFKEVKALIPNIDICVTIPYYLDVIDQIGLAKNLDVLGVNIIQTEGMSNTNYSESKLGIYKKDFSHSSNCFIPSLLSTYILSKTTKVPILASSGFKNITSPIAKLYGASGVGISSSFKQQNDITSILKYIIQTTKSLDLIDAMAVKNDPSNISFTTINEILSYAMF